MPMEKDDGRTGVARFLLCSLGEGAFLARHQSMTVSLGLLTSGVEEGRSLISRASTAHRVMHEVFGLKVGLEGWRSWHRLALSSQESRARLVFYSH